VLFKTQKLRYKNFPFVILSSAVDLLYSSVDLQ